MSFKSSAIRHYKDGNTLFEGGRFDNADQLFGFATECAIKACLPRRCFVNNVLDDEYRKHIDKLWISARILIEHKAFPALHSMLQLRKRPFENWKTENRYEMTGTISAEICQEHQKWAARVLGAADCRG